MGTSENTTNGINGLLTKWILGIASTLIVLHIAWASSEIIDVSSRLARIETHMSNVDNKLQSMPPQDYRGYVDYKFQYIEKEQDNIRVELLELSKKLDKVLDKLE